MSAAITGYPMAGQTGAVASSIALLCRWLTDHPAGATVPTMLADRDFQERCDRCLTEPTAESIAEAVRILGDQRRLAQGPVVRLRPELRPVGLAAPPGLPLGPGAGRDRDRRRRCCGAGSSGCSTVEPAPLVSP